jgi:hypothetical protein
MVCENEREWQAYPVEAKVFFGRKHEQILPLPAKRTENNFFLAPKKQLNHEKEVSKEADDELRHPGQHADHGRRGA